TPAANANGSTAFSFQVQDDGGTANGGVNLDQSANTLTVRSEEGRVGKEGTDGSVTTLEDKDKVLTAANFGFTDPSDSPANALAAVEITTLPGSGSLALNGVAVTAGQLVSVADINAGLLVYTPAANANGSTAFSFQVQDDGGTANGGVNLDQSANTLTVNITSVNDAPVASGSATLAATNEDTAAPVGASVSSLFGGNFSDAADQVAGGSIANTFNGIAISSYTVD